MGAPVGCRIEPGFGFSSTGKDHRLVRRIEVQRPTTHAGLSPRTPGRWRPSRSAVHQMRLWAVRALQIFWTLRVADAGPRGHRPHAPMAPRPRRLAPSSSTSVLMAALSRRRPRQRPALVAQTTWPTPASGQRACQRHTSAVDIPVRRNLHGAASRRPTEARSRSARPPSYGLVFRSAISRWPIAPDPSGHSSYA